MCGRFAITLPTDALARAFDARPANGMPDLPRYNICPTMKTAAIINRGGTRYLAAMRWGFLPHWYKSETDGPLLINARAETLAQKPAFAQAARKNRCLIPASGFFEWHKDAQGQRLPWYIRPRDGGPMAFAGVWQIWQQGDLRHVTCAIVTCAANVTLAPIHHRMPVILRPDDWDLWLGNAGHGAARLMQPTADDLLDAFRVATAVNSNRAEGPELLDPLSDPNTGEIAE